MDKTLVEQRAGHRRTGFVNLRRRNKLPRQRVAIKSGIGHNSGLVPRSLPPATISPDRGHDI